MATDWQAREIARQRAEIGMLREHIKRQAVTIAEFELRDAKREAYERTDTAWLQGKVLRQKRIIKAREEALALASAQSMEDAVAREEHGD